MALMIERHQLLWYRVVISAHDNKAAHLRSSACGAKYGRMTH